MNLLRKMIMLTTAVVTIPCANATPTEKAVATKATTPQTSQSGERESTDSSSVEYGKASWYCIKCNGGTHTASGKKLNDWAMTAAHKTLPMGTKVRVTNKVNGRSVVVTITDRGPYIKGRIIDVTKGVAHKLNFVNAGVVPCKVEVL